MSVHTFKEEVVSYLANRLRKSIGGFLERNDDLIEIRLRVNQPLLVRTIRGDTLLTLSGEETANLARAYIVSVADLEETIQLVSKGSLYALEEEFKRGFITLEGGHRVGMVGRVILENGQIRTMRDISFINIRIAREIRGVALELLPYVLNSYSVANTLIFSSPGMGKTTMLRDLIRLLAEQGKTVAVVDERYELSGSYRGVPMLNLGMRTDVLSGCPKAEGIILMLRTMNPDIIATDEIGREDDAIAIQEALNAGVSVIATAHANSLKEIEERPVLANLLKRKYFQRLVRLGDSRGLGTIEAVTDGFGKELRGGKIRVTGSIPR